LADPINYTPPAYSQGSLNIDLFANHQTFYQSPNNPRYHYRVQATGERGKYKGELIIYDFRGGTGLTYGDFNRDFDRSAFSVDNQADARFSRFLTLPMKTQTSTTPDPTGTSIGMSHERIAWSTLSSMVAFWPLDELSGNAIDAHAAFDLTDTNTVTTSGGWRQFTRANSERFTIADSADLSLGSGVQFTIGGFVRFDTAGANRMDFCGKNDGASPEFVFLLLNTGSFQFQFWDTGGTQRVLGDGGFGAVSTATSYHVMATYDGTTLTIYINGAAETTSTALVGGVRDGAGAFQLGAANSTNHLDGGMKQWVFDKRCYSATEVAAHAAGLTYASLANTNSGLVIGSGESLLYEAAASDDLVTTSYLPGSAITATDAIVLGGATATRKLLVGRTGGVAQLLDPATGLVSTTGHADLNPCWGACQTFLNNDTVLFYADNGIYALAKTAALSDAPTLTLSNLADGGYFLDNEPFRLGNSPYRCFLALPKQDTPGGMVPFGDTGDFEIVSINQEGFDPVPVNFPMLPKIKWAGRFRNGIVASDGLTIAYYDGETYFHTSPFGQRLTRDVDVLEITAIWTIGGDLYIRISESLLNTTFNHVTMMWDFEALAWQVTSIDSNDASVGTPPRSRGLPWSFNSSTSRYMYIYEAGSWKAQSWTYLEENPFFIQEDGSLLGSQEFEASAGVTSPYWELPGLEGKPKAITAITFMGDLVTGNASDNTTPTQVVVTAGGRTATFKSPADSDWIGTQRIEFKPDEVFDRLRMTITGTQGSGGTKPTYYTPNMLPIKIEWIAWEYPTPNIGQILSLPLHD
jgi:hypothetical protein